MDGIRVKLDCEETTGAIIGYHPYITSLSAVHKDFASRSERQYYKISSSGLFQSKNYIKMPTFDFLFTGECTVCAFSSSFILILLTVPCSLILFCVLFSMKAWAGMRKRCSRQFTSTSRWLPKWFPSTITGTVRPCKIKFRILDAQLL